MGVEYAPRQTEAVAIVTVKAASVAKELKPVTVTTREKAKTKKKTTDARPGASWRGGRCSSLSYSPHRNSFTLHRFFAAFLVLLADVRVTDGDDGAG